MINIAVCSGILSLDLRHECAQLPTLVTTALGYWLLIAWFECWRAEA